MLRQFYPSEMLFIWCICYSWYVFISNITGISNNSVLLRCHLPSQELITTVFITKYFYLCAHLFLNIVWNFHQSKHFVIRVNIKLSYLYTNKKNACSWIVMVDHFVLDCYIAEAFVWSTLHQNLKKIWLSKIYLW